MRIEDIPLVRVAIRVLAERVMTLIAMVMTFGLSAWVMYQPTWQREGMAAFFAVFVFLPCILRDRRNTPDGKTQTDHEDRPKE